MHHRRSAFTLIEILVVLAIIALIGGLVAFAFPGFQERSRAAKGGTALQGWLNYARQRALAEQAPRGLRFLFSTQSYATNPGPTNIAVVTECQYIERPDDYVGGTLKDATASAVFDPNEPTYLSQKRLIWIQGADFSDGSVEAGDRLEVFGAGQTHSIGPTWVVSGPVRPNDLKNPTKLDKLVLESGLPESVATTNFRILRAPRVTGDESVKLPTGIIVDLSMIQKHGGFTPAPVWTDGAKTQGYFDVLFSPFGAMLDTGGDKLILWVRVEPALAFPNDEFKGNPTLIVVSTNTGAVSAYDPVKGNAYQKVR